VKTSELVYRTVSAIFVAFAFVACAEAERESGTNTNWISCETTSDCHSTTECVNEQCVPRGIAVQLVPSKGGTEAAASSGSSDRFQPHSWMRRSG
jgi:hypothetical protein